MSEDRCITCGTKDVLFQAVEMETKVPVVSAVTKGIIVVCGACAAIILPKLLPALGIVLDFLPGK
jgi:hypothetical protein